MRYTIIILGLSAALNGLSQKNFNEVDASTEIKSATVFLQGAQLHRSGTANVQAGYNTVILRDLSTSIDPSSIQIKGGDNYTIVSVNYQKNYLESPEEQPSIKKLKKRLHDLALEKSKVEVQLGVYEKEKQLILKNKKVTSANKGLDIEDVMDMSDLIRARFPEIHAGIKRFTDRKQDLSEEISKVNRQLSEENARIRRETGEIYIDVTSRSGGMIRFQCDYIVRDAGWTPAYDVRAFSVREPVYMTYKANVWQSTGVPWKKISLTLSTGNPSKGATPPHVGVWRLDFSQPQTRYYEQGDYMDEPAPALEEVTIESRVVDVKDKEKTIAEKREEYRNRQTSAQYTRMNSDRVNTEWTIDIPYTIPENGKSQSVEISQIELDALYEHYSIPKIDIDAFLLARITGWDKHNLLPGQASIYFEGAYTGKAFLETRTTKDTLDLSMGRDRSIVVEREKVKEFSKLQTIGSNKKLSNGFEIRIRNTKKEAIEMKVIDQLPKSRNKDVEVTLEKADGGVLNESTGEIEWVFSLEPGATKTIRFVYQVKYPKDWTISNL